MTDRARRQRVRYDCDVCDADPPDHDCGFAEGGAAACAHECHLPKPAPVDHRDHGAESPDEYPNATHCPCTGVAPLTVQLACALTGCRYCRVSICTLPQGGATP